MSVYYNCGLCSNFKEVISEKEIINHLTNHHKVDNRQARESLIFLGMRSVFQTSGSWTGVIGTNPIVEGENKDD